MGESDDREYWQLGDAVVDLATQRVRRRDGGETRLTPRAVAVLRALIEAGDRPLSRDSLLARIWAQSDTGDEVVSKAVNELRLALGDHDTRQRRYIETIPKLGYRLICACDPLDAPCTPATVPAGVGAPAPATEKTSRRRASRASIMALVAAPLAIGAALWFASSHAPAEGAWPAQRLRMALAAKPRVVAPATDYLGYADVLPDGSRALYAGPLDGTVRVVTRPLDGSAATRVSALADGAEFAPAASHDGRTLAYQHFVDGTCRIRLHNVADRSERDLAGCSSRFAEWLEFSPDGRFLIVPRMRPGDTTMSLHRIDVRDGATVAWDYPRDPAASDVQARWSPDGRRLAIRRGAQPHSGLWLYEPDGGRLRRLVEDTFGLDGYAWLPDGRALVIGVHDGADAGLWRIDAQTGKREPLGARGGTCPVVSQTGGTLLFTHSERRYALVRVTTGGRTGTAPADAFPTARGADWYPRRSADGRHVAFLSDRDGPVAVYVGRVDGGEPVRLPDLPGAVPHATPAPTADARRVLVPMRGGDGRVTLYDIEVGQPAWHRVGSVADDVEEAFVSADDRWTWYVTRTTQDTRVLWRRSRETGAEQRIADGLARGPIAGDRRGGIYYVDAARQSLLRRDPETGDAEPWLDDMGYWTAYGWTVGDDGVYAVREPAGKDFGLYRVEEGKAAVLVAPMDGISPLGLAVTPDGTALIATPPRGAQTLMSVPLPQEPAPTR